MSVSACQLGRKPLCNSSACETGNAAQTDSCLQRIKSLILTKEPPQKLSQSQTLKTWKTWLFAGSPKAAVDKNKLLIHLHSKEKTSVSTEKHRSCTGMLPRCLPRTFSPKHSIHYRNYLTSGSASKVCAFHHDYIIQ